MRSTDVLLSIPGILLAIGIVAWLDRGMWQLMLAIAVTYAPIFARSARDRCSPCASRTTSSPRARWARPAAGS